jgi:hypothetical protein
VTANSVPKIPPEVVDVMNRVQSQIKGRQFWVPVVAGA